MKDDDLNLKPQYRMPRVFGALPGPRNVPKDKQNLPDNQTDLVIAVTVLTDTQRLAELLPPNAAWRASMYAVMEEGETLMKAGDVLVQRGANHAWSNRSGEMCRVAFILVDGRRD